MKTFFILSALACTIVAQPSLAVVPPTPGVVFQPNTSTLPSWTTAQIFQDFHTATPNQSPYAGQSGPLPMGGTFTEGTSGATTVASGSVASGNTNEYLNLFVRGSGNGRYTLQFSEPQQYFSFAFSASDPASSIIRLLLSDGSFFRYSLDSYGNNGRLNIDLGGQAGIVYFDITNGGDSLSTLSVDSFAAAAPEPASWAMMIVGFGLIGAGLRFRAMADRKRHLA